MSRSEKLATRGRIATFPGQCSWLCNRLYRQKFPLSQVNCPSRQGKSPLSDAKVRSSQLNPSDVCLYKSERNGLSCVKASPLCLFSPGHLEKAGSAHHWSRTKNLAEGASHENRKFLALRRRICRNAASALSLLLDGESLHKAYNLCSNLVVRDSAEIADQSRAVVAC